MAQVRDLREFLARPMNFAAGFFIEAHMTDNVVWGTDFRKGRELVTDLTMLAADIVHQITIPYEPPTPHDSAPEMNCAGEKEPA